MSGSEQIILSILGTVVSGVLVYWLTVGLARRRTTAATAETLSTAKDSKSRSLLDRLSNRASSFQGDMKAQLEEALGIQDKIVRNAVLDKLVEILISKADFKSAEAAAIGLVTWSTGRGYDFEGSHSQDFKSKLNLAKVLHSNNRYSDAARVIASVVSDHWREKASKEVFGQEKK
jgi:hypothetical protein